MNYESANNNKRIAKNTLVLYVRTIVVMLISLFSSRIILDALGEKDYGTYNVIGGVVSMLSILSGALSSSISRYLTFELGHGDKKKLNQVFSTSINIQVSIAIIILIIGEILGVWFLNYKMNIPTERLYAANWVLHCSILTFTLGLITVPFNALIIAHEKMNIFAYVSIFDAVAKLSIAYLLYISPWDRLIFYAILLVFIPLSTLFFYSIYCNHKFAEAHYHTVHDKQLTKEMTQFAGWGFFTNSAYMFNTQGVNILINLFFGVSVNAARAVTVQVESVITKFVNDFMTAINPQITKSYAQGDMEGMYTLVIRGAKFSMFLFLLMSLPIILETDYILNLWLVKVPEHTVNFVRLSIIGTMMMSIGNTGYTACMATGNIKRYSLWITLVGCLIFPISYLAFYIGLPVETTYVIFILVYFAVDMVRLWLMKSMLHFPVWRFIRETFVKLLFISTLAIIIPFYIHYYMPQNFYRFVFVILSSVIICVLLIWLIGFTSIERIGMKRQFSKYIKVFNKIV